MTNYDLEIRELQMPELAAFNQGKDQVINYAFAVDSSDRLYIKILKSTGGAQVSSRYFEINSVIESLGDPRKPFKGIKDSLEVEDRNDSTPGFLRAIVEHLLNQKV